MAFYYTIRTDGVIGKEAVKLNMFYKYVDNTKQRILLSPTQFDRARMLAYGIQGTLNKLNSYYKDDEPKYTQDWWNRNINNHKIKDSKYWKGRIQITLETYQKMYHYTNASKGEISGFGKVEKQGDNYIITDIKIFTQKCTYAHTTLTQDALTAFVVQLVKDKEEPNDWKLWWHTHNDFGAGFSGEDGGNIALLTEGKNSLLLAICMNKMGDLEGRIESENTTYNDIEVTVIDTAESKIKEECYAEVKEKVTFEKYRWTKRDEKEWRKKHKKRHKNRHTNSDIIYC